MLIACIQITPKPPKSISKELPPMIMEITFVMPRWASDDEENKKLRLFFVKKMMGNNL